MVQGEMGPLVLVGPPGDHPKQRQGPSRLGGCATGSESQRQQRRDAARQGGRRGEEEVRQPDHQGKRAAPTIGRNL